MAKSEAAEKLSAKGLKCLFSGKPTKTDKARFLPGYDAKMKSLLLAIFRGQKNISEVRKDAIPFLESTEGLVGFRLVGGKLKHIGNFSVAEPKAKKEKAAKADAPAKAKVKIKKAAKPAVEEEEEEEEE